MRKDIREDRYMSIVDSLSEESALFKELLAIGDAFFTEDISTACVVPDEWGELILFCFNPSFFDYNSDYTNKFIIAHEMLHIVLGHGRSGKNLIDKKKANRMMDVSINHMLVDSFDFDRCLVDNWRDYCWRDTVFKTFIEPQSSFEGYYKVPDELIINGAGNTVDNHDGLGDIFGSDGLMEKISEIITDHINELPTHGDGSETRETILSVTQKKKANFEKLVRKISKSAIKESPKMQYSWGSLDRRLSNVCCDLPDYRETEKVKSFDRYRCQVYVDNSGSCFEFCQRFINVISGINEKDFEISVFSFDTKISKVEKVNGEYIIRGGGGTSFKPIIKKINEDLPDVVFVLTDGQASMVGDHPMKKKTFWFLTENGSKKPIEKAGSVYKLSNYE